MFHFTDPGRAILAALDLVDQTEHAMRVPARMGINAGTVITQEGDYFGCTVNIAARIADYAQPHEVLVSDDTRQVAHADGVEFEPIGDVRLKGVSQSVRLYRVAALGSAPERGQLQLVRIHLDTDLGCVSDCAIDARGLLPCVRSSA